jgi:hypothetical protein
MEGIETSAVEFFTENELPPLPIVRNTKNTIEMAFRHFKNFPPSGSTTMEERINFHHL